MKNRYLSVISLVIALSMLLLASCGGVEKKDTPEKINYLEMIFEKTFAELSYEAKTSKSELVWDSASEDVSSSYRIAELTLYKGTSKESVIISKAPIDAFIYSLGDSVVASSSLLGKNPIGATFDELKDIIELYSPSDGTDVSSGDEAISLSSIFGLIEVYNAANGNGTKEFAERYLKAVLRSSENAAENNVSTSDSGVVVELSFDLEGTKRAARELYDVAKNDGDLKALFEGAVRASDASQSEVAELIRRYNDFFSDEDKFNELFNGIRSESFSSFVRVTSDRSLALKTIFLEIKADEQSLTFSIDVSSPDEVTLSYEGAIDGTNESFTLSFVTEREGDITRKTCYINASSGGSSDEIELYCLQYSDDSEFALRTNLLGTPSGMSGRTSESNGVYTLTVTSITAEGIMKNVDLTVTTEYDVEIPKAPTDFKRLKSLTTTEISAIISNLKSSPGLREILGVFRG